LGFTYGDCLASCVANSVGADEEGMQACVDLCKSNYPTTPATTPPAGKELIAGVSNQTLVLGAAAVVVVMMMMRR
jgi:hypothetical protein